MKLPKESASPEIHPYVHYQQLLQRTSMF